MNAEYEQVQAFCNDGILQWNIIWILESNLRQFLHQVKTILDSCTLLISWFSQQ